ncbi:type IV toxin-antitoxin system AbiEi family antitoxin domain-containing protein [Frondihabitans cladoniiphilus]|uniref:Transcriptional regulator, AbiEi antitoxin, Type IV TA system n=1 Tax=Frondihabitans cladoniiphilus TaxID=715785 RepID=A0ABP8VYD8_9MICO
MHTDPPASPIEGVFVSRGATDERALRTLHESGRIRRLRRGAYVDAAMWNAASRRERSILRIHAVIGSRGFADIVSHDSAAVLHGVSLLREPEEVHVLDPSARSTRRRNGLVLHAGSLTESDRLARPPFLVTTPRRTLVDVARSLPFRDGVAALDSALRTGLLERDSVRHEVESSGMRYGEGAVLRALAFADERAANPGESLSRVVIHELGFQAPTILQKEFRDRRGRIGFTDFWWEEAGIVGEFDGFAKYSKPEYLGALSPSQVVVREKARERRLEAHPEVSRVARWVWSDLMNPPRLFALLSEARVPRRAGQSEERRTAAARTAGEANR